MPGGVPGEYLRAEADGGAITEFQFDFDMHPRLVPATGNAYIGDASLAETNERFVY